MDNLGRSYLWDKIITSLFCWAHYNLTHELKVLYGYPLKIMVSFQPMSYCKELEEFPKVVLIFTWDPSFRIEGECPLACTLRGLFAASPGGKATGAM